MTHLPHDLVERVAKAIYQARNVICVPRLALNPCPLEVAWQCAEVREELERQAIAALNAASSWLTERVEKVADPGVSSQALKSAEREPAEWRAKL